MVADAKLLSPERLEKWRELFPLPWSRLEPSVTWIAAKNGEHALDVRGWGHMTGTGGGLAMSPDDAIAVQRELGEHVVKCVNEHDDLVAKLEALSTLLKSVEAERLPAHTTEPSSRPRKNDKMSEKLYQINFEPETPRNKASWLVSGEGFGVRSFSTEEAAEKAAETYFGVAKFTLSIWPDRTQLRVMAAPGADPATILSQAISALEDEQVALSNCPIHKAENGQVKLTAAEHRASVARDMALEEAAVEADRHSMQEHQAGKLVAAVRGLKFHREGK